MPTTRIGQTGPLERYPGFTAKSSSVVVSPVGSIVPTLFVELELSGSGNGWTDVARDVCRDYRVTITHGIQGGGPNDNMAETGTCVFGLDNSTHNSAGLLGYYSPYNANKRSGWGLDIGCRVRLQDPNTGEFYTRFWGRIDAIDPAPGVALSRIVRVTATDWIEELARFKIPPDVGVQVGKRADEIMAAIMAYMEIQPLAATLDIGSESYSYALDTAASTQRPALVEFVKLARSEYGLVFQRGNGVFRFESRHNRLFRTTLDWIIPETDYRGLSLPSTRDEIIDVARVTIHPKQVDPDPTTVVYDQTNAIQVAAGATKFYDGSYRDPFTGDPIQAVDVQDQVSGTDYIATTNEDGTGADLSADFTVSVIVGGPRFIVTNGGAVDGYLSTNRLLGRAVYDRGQQQFQSPEGVIGTHPVDFDMDYQDDDDVGQGAADYIYSKYSAPFAQVRMIQVPAKNSSLLTQVLARDISDRIRPSETVTGLDSEYFINGETFTVLASGHVVADYILTPAEDPFSGLYWIVDTSVLGSDTIPAPF